MPAIVKIVIRFFEDNVNTINVGGHVVNLGVGRYPVSQVLEQLSINAQISTRQLARLLRAQIWV